MPKKEIAADRFVEAHPEFDGRGAVIAIFGIFGGFMIDCDSLLLDLSWPETHGLSQLQAFELERRVVIFKLEIYNSCVEPAVSCLS